MTSGPFLSSHWPDVGIANRCVEMCLIGRRWGMAALYSMANDVVSSL